MGRKRRLSVEVLRKLIKRVNTEIELLERYVREGKVRLFKKPYVDELREKERERKRLKLKLEAQEA